MHRRQLRSVSGISSSLCLSVDRVCNTDCEIGGYKIAKGTLINIGIWAVHHDEEYWPEPEKFDPDRFAPENKDRIVPCSFIPFGQGPRNCIGMRLANMEAKMGVARVVQRFVIERCAKTEVLIEECPGGLFSSSLEP
jgi:cytochrome P450